MSPPVLSVVTPCLDERRALDGFVARVEAAALAAGLAGRFELVVADGGSTDGTRERLEALAARRAWLRVVDNPGRHPGAGRNAGLRAARGERVAIVDMHWEVGPDYFRALLPALDDPTVGAAGGAFATVPAEGRVQRLVGLALQSPLATGPGMRTDAGAEGGWREAPTVPGGVFRRALFARLGTFDERLLRAEDDAFLWRVREAGLRVLQHPGVRVGYVPRRSLAALWRQYHGYGVYKRWALRRPGWGRAQWLPLALVAYVAAALALLGPRPRTGAALLLAYPAALTAADQAWRRRAARPAPLAVLGPTAVMQLAYGLGLWRGLLSAPTSRPGAGARTPGRLRPRAP